MCQHLGIVMPPPAEALALAHEASTFVTQRVYAAIPGVIDAIRMLHGQGYTLHTASGESSTDLHGYLTTMGVRGCFGGLYGPDLVDIFKAGPCYYEAIFADANVSPTDALVVDDNPRCAAFARQAGARAIVIDDSPVGDLPTLASLSLLPDLLRAWG